MSLAFVRVAAPAYRFGRAETDKGINLSQQQGSSAARLVREKETCQCSLPWVAESAFDACCKQRMTSPSDLPDIGRYAAVLHGLQNLDNGEILPIVKGLLAPTPREECFIAGYYRMLANARTLLELNNASHFQGIAMLARCMFELVVDIALIDHVPDAITKIYAYARLERLRGAREKVELRTAGVISDDVTLEEKYMTTNGVPIEAEAQALWPKTKKQRLVSHWSDLGLAARTKKLGEPFNKLYMRMYRQLSWHVHPGLAGVMNMDASAFPAMCGLALEFAFTCYAIALRAVAKELKIDKAVKDIDTKVQLAKMLPFTGGEAQAAALVDAMLG